jgi:hypothetical protein
VIVGTPPPLFQSTVATTLWGAKPSPEMQ